jgi:hypothetical protein
MRRIAKWQTKKKQSFSEKLKRIVKGKVKSMAEKHTDEGKPFRSTPATTIGKKKTKEEGGPDYLPGASDAEHVNLKEEGWPEEVTDVYGFAYWRLRDGKPDAEGIPGHSVLYGKIVRQKEKGGTPVVEAQMQYVPAWNSRLASQVVLEGREWVDEPDLEKTFKREGHEKEKA